MRLLPFVFCTCTSAAGTDPRWTSAAPLPEPFQELHAAVLNGRISLAGGFDGTRTRTRVA